MTGSLQSLPDNLPKPVDDGAADHLLGMALPELTLPATNGEMISPGQIARRLVIYAYPMTGRPDVPLPDGWDEIPGARGCTPQSCSFRDHYAELQALDAEVFGLSTQSTDYQKEMVDRLHLPFPVLSDADHGFADALRLPTFEVAGLLLLKRLTMIVDGGIIRAVHYPVFPSDSDPDWVMNTLRQMP